MNSKNFSEAMNKLEDKYITEAITYNHMSKTGTRRHIKKGFLIAALIAALLLLCAAAYAIIRSYSTTIENTTLGCSVCFGAGENTGLLRHSGIWAEALQSRSFFAS